MGACLRSLYLSRAGAVAGTVAGAFSRPCHESRSRRLGPALATRCMRRLLFIAPGAVAGAPSSPSTGDRRARALGSSLGGGEESDRGVDRAEATGQRARPKADGQSCTLATPRGSSIRVPIGRLSPEALSRGVFASGRETRSGRFFLGPQWCPTELVTYPFPIALIRLS